MRGEINKLKIDNGQWKMKMGGDLWRAEGKMGENLTTKNMEFYVCSAHLRAALTPQIGSMTPLNLLPQRFVSKPQAEWLLHGAAVSLHPRKGRKIKAAAS